MESVSDYLFDSRHLRKRCEELSGAFSQGHADLTNENQRCGFVRFFACCSKQVNELFQRGPFWGNIRLSCEPS